MLKTKELENNFPECLQMKIRGELVKPKQMGLLAEMVLAEMGLLAEIIPQEPDSEAIELFLQIIFHEQWIDFSFGEVRFGLKGGELRLTLENGRMPYELRNKDLKKSLETELTVERNVVEETENKPQIEASLVPDLTKAGLKVTLGKNQKKSRSDKFQFKIAQITSKGGDNKPVWVFENKTEEPFLLGDLDTLLGKILIDDKKKSCKVEARFVTEIRQVVIRGLKNKSGKDIFDTGRLNWFEIHMAKSFLDGLTKSHLSRQVLFYEE